MTKGQEDDAILRNLEAQVDLYGEPLATVFGRLTEGLGLTQGSLAKALGMSPAMVSHLVSGKRVKIGNPAVQRRLEEVQALHESVRTGELASDAVAERLARIRESTGSWTAARHEAHRADPPAEQDVDETEAQTVHSLLRAIASGSELLAAADLLQSEHPGLAELVRTYGLGGPAERVDHLRRHRGLF